MAVQEWVHIDKPENEEVILERSKQFGKDCFLLNKVKTTDDEEFRQKLKEVITSIFLLLNNFLIEIT